MKLTGIKAVLFDFDDTLGNREAYAYMCYRDTLEKFRTDEDDFEFEAILQQCMIWDQNGEVNKNYVKERVKERFGFEIGIEDFNAYWNAHLWEFTIPFEETKRTLDILKEKYQLGIITNGPSDGQRKKIEKAQIQDYFDDEHIIVSGDHPFSKPDPEIFLLACERLHVKPEEAVYVGDLYSRDVLGAHRAGLTPIWIWTHGNRRDSNNVITIHGIEEILEYL